MENQETTKNTSYYERNKEALQLKHRIYYQEHRKKLLTKAKNYYEDNREEVLKKGKMSVKKKAYNKIYWHKNKHKYKALKKYMDEAKRIREQNIN